MNRARFYTLLQYYKEDTISEEEWQELQSMIKTGRYDDQLEDDILISLDSAGKNEKWTVEIEKEILTGVYAKIEKNSKTPYYRTWYAVAAVLLMMLTAGFIFFKSGHLRSAVTQNTANNNSDVLPGGNKAILTLPNGKQIALKAANGILLYEADALAGNFDAGIGEEKFNTISTPRGGQYQVVLPDGTHVWLNAASSLKFPASFKGRKRLVSLIGEAYFEVAQNKKMPFIVQTENQEVEVLGTHFNVNSYTDDLVAKTTLLEGSVKIISQGNQKILTPGEQAQINRNTKTINVTSVSIEETIAWKNGYFVFNDEKLESIMHRVSRWYDVEYEIQSQLGKLSFLGIVERSKNISSLLKVLESTGNVHFKIEGRKIIVMP